MVIVGKITTTILLCESYVKRTKNMNIEISTGCVLFLLLRIALNFGQCYRYFMVGEEASRMCFIKYKWRSLTGHNWNQDKLWRYHYARIVILTMSRGSCFCFSHLLITTVIMLHLCQLLCQVVQDEFAVWDVVLVDSVLSEILGANEVVSDVFDELSSTKWMNWILYAIVGLDMLTIFDATIDSFINICENCWSIYEIEQVWVMFYPGSSTRIATLRGGFDTVWNDLFFKSLSVCIW